MRKTSGETYEMLNGETLELREMTPGLRSFVDHVRAAVENESVTVGQVTDLVYGLENPILDKGVMPGRAVVTRAVFADPVWHMLCDLIGRKRAATGALDVGAAEARYTMTVPDAAERIGVHESAVRQALATKRLSGWKRGARWFLDPEEVARYRAGPQGPASALHVRVGSAPGASFRIKHQGGELVETDRAGGALAATLSNWQRVAVIGGTKEKARFWLIEPGDELDTVAFGDFFVRGRLRVVERLNNEREAREAFKAFRGS